MKWEPWVKGGASVALLGVIATASIRNYARTRSELDAKLGYDGWTLTVPARLTILDGCNTEVADTATFRASLGGFSYAPVKALAPTNGLKPQTPGVARSLEHLGVYLASEGGVRLDSVLNTVYQKANTGADSVVSTAECQAYVDRWEELLEKLDARITGTVSPRQT